MANLHTPAPRPVLRQPPRLRQSRFYWAIIDTHRTVMQWLAEDTAANRRRLRRAMRLLSEHRAANPIIVIRSPGVVEAPAHVPKEYIERYLHRMRTDRQYAGRVHRERVALVSFDSYMEHQINFLRKEQEQQR